MSRTILNILLTFCFWNANSQVDTLNRFDSHNKKTGYWKTFLDENLIPTDSTSSYFFGYEYYDSGSSRFAFVNDGYKKRHQGKFSIGSRKRGSPIILNGEFVWLTKGDSSEYVKEIYSKGHPVIFLVVKDLCISDFIDYSTRYNNQAGSFYSEFCSCNNDRCEAYWSYRTGKKWIVKKIGTFLRSEQRSRLKNLDKLSLDVFSRF
jgi:hypothetical protein